MLLLAPSPLFHSFSRRPLSFSYPLLSFRSLRHRERGGHDTCQSTADARIDTDGPRLLSFTLSISLSFSTLSPPPLPSSYCRQLPFPRHPPQPTSPSPFITSPVTAAHPATNLLRMLALYARLALNVWPAVSIGILSIETEEASNSVQMFSSLTNRDEILVV